VNSAGPLGIIFTLVPSLIIALLHRNAWFIHRAGPAWPRSPLGMLLRSVWLRLVRSRLPSGVQVRVPASEAAYLKHVGLFYALVGAMGLPGRPPSYFGTPDLREAIACGRQG